YVYEKEGRPDIIYGHFAAKAGTSAVRMAKKYHLPVAVIEHGGNIMVPQKSPYLGGVLKYISDRADALICVSTKQKEFVEKHCRKTDRMYVVPNMVEPMFDYREHEKGQPFTFFAAGNLYKMKRMDLLINAYADVFSEDDQVVLRIAGLGWEQEHLESIIRERHLENRVSLLGRLDRHQIYDEYVNCDVFAMASEHESFGIAYREAMCVGRPVVSSENGGIREGWSSKFGLLVPVDDREALGNALRTIYEKYDQYELKEISALNREQTSPENVMGQLISIFEKAILNHQK
ncbi:MAG: glycosyltransferase, partial [Lachnospiraceae bacterium]|nr:glycosyltransferase [Candidatus Equihabitans merdae]